MSNTSTVSVGAVDGNAMLNVTYSQHRQRLFFVLTLTLFTPALVQFRLIISEKERLPSQLQVPEREAVKCRVRHACTFQLHSTRYLQGVVSKYRAKLLLALFFTVTVFLLDVIKM
jgi:hypothetical protein